MKIKVINARVVRAAILSLSVSTLFLVSLLPQSAVAQVSANESPSSAIIKYVGFVEDKLLFNVDIENKNEERSWISIQDENGEVLFREDFKDARYAKTFAINKYEVEGKNLVFVLIKGKVRQEHLFHVATNTRIIEDVIVDKQ